jgi:hypothetical protein
MNREKNCLRDFIKIKSLFSFSPFTHSLNTEKESKTSIPSQNNSTTQSPTNTLGPPRKTHTPSFQNMCFLKEPLLQTLESTIQKTLSLDHSTNLYLSSLDLSLSKALNNSNCALIKFLTRLQNPHGVYEQRLKKYNKKNGFPGCPQINRYVDSWRYEDCLRRHEKKKNLNKEGDGEEGGRFEERRREEKDKVVESWMGGMEGMSWNRKVRCYRNEIDG